MFGGVAAWYRCSEARNFRPASRRRRRQSGDEQMSSIRHGVSWPVGQECVDAEDAQHAGEVVAERHQAPFAAHLVEAAQQEVAVSGAAFERAEGMLHQGCPAAHDGVRLRHPRAVPLDHILMHPAIHVASPRLGGETVLAERAYPADRPAAGIADLQFAGPISLVALHPPQLRPLPDSGKDRPPRRRRRPPR